MAQNSREQPLGIGARKGELIGVTNASGLDFHQNLALLRVGEVHLHDFKRLTGGKGDSGTGAHEHSPIYLTRTCSKRAEIATRETLYHPPRRRIARLAIAPRPVLDNMPPNPVERVTRRVPFTFLLASLSRSIAPALTCALALSGCVILHPELAMGPVERMIPPLPDHCRAGALAELQGKDFTLLADRKLAGDLRVIWPAQQISGDLDSTRLNVQVDTSGRIKRLFCG
jgi:hypothetical protein